MTFILWLASCLQRHPHRPIWIVFAILSSPLFGDVVINEIFYHAPDELKLEYIELLNAGDEAVDISGWKISDEVEYEFPVGTNLAAGSFVVVASSNELLREFYDVDALGEFEKKLSNSGGRVKLSDATGREIESVTYGDRAPWSIAADGYSASLERVCPTDPANHVANWAPSTLSDDYDRKPSGSPGKANSVLANALPPSLESVTWNPKQPACESFITITVKPKDLTKIKAAEVRYGLVAPGDVGESQLIPMVKENDLLTAKVPTGNTPNRLLRFSIVATGNNGGVVESPSHNELRPQYTAYVSGRVEKDRIPVVQLFHVAKQKFDEGEQYRESQSQPSRGSRFGGFRGRPDFGGRRGGGRRGPFDGFPPTSLVPQGESAVVYTDPMSGDSEVFDFVNVVRRKSGWKVRFHKDKPLLGMTTVNFLYEPDERTVLNESLAYQVYQAAGNVAYKHGFARLVINGNPVGFHLYFEQPNGNFFRRNEIKDDGDLYKLIWMGNAEMSERVSRKGRTNRPDITGRYEKKSNRHDGHQHLVNAIESLEAAKTDEETWQLIENHFEVKQVINYFAVNSLLSHWDGFFNNHFVYYDRKGTGKWSIYPWDQDSTWSQRGGRGDELYAMPIFFGAEGATPDGLVKVDKSKAAPNPGRGGFGRGFGGRGFGGRGRGLSWWRDGGDFSRPLLANPTFYKRFKKRLAELTTKEFTEETFGPKFASLQASLKPEVELRARIRKSNEAAAVDELANTIDALRQHLVERRKFIRNELELD